MLRNGSSPQLRLAVVSDASSSDGIFARSTNSAHSYSGRRMKQPLHLRACIMDSLVMVSHEGTI
jgi:hypothetical protein